MKKLTVLVLSLSFLLPSIFASAQLPSMRNIRNRVIDRAADRAVDRAIDKTSQKMDEGVDKSVDKVFDSLFGNTSQSSTTETENSNTGQSQADALKMFNGMLGGLGNAAPPNASYSFSSSYVMKINSSSEDGNFDMKSKYYFTDNGDYVGTKILGSTDPKMNEGMQAMEAMIMDFGKSSMYTFMNSNGKKSMIGMSLNTTETAMANESLNKNVEASSFTKTGASKNIAGYMCDAYLLKQGTDENTVWISRSRVPVVSKYYESFQKMSSSGKSKININYAANDEMLKFAKEGRAMLGMDSIQPNGDKMNMEVTEIKENDSYSFSTAGYENMMDFNKIRQDAQNQQNADN